MLLNCVLLTGMCSTGLRYFSMASLSVSFLFYLGNVSVNMDANADNRMTL